MTLRFSAMAIAAALLCSVMRLPAGATPAGDALQRTYSREVETFLHDQPIVATLLGDYRFDGQLGLAGPAALTKREADLSRLEREVDAVDMRGATLRERDDVTLIHAIIAGQRRSLGQTREGKDAGAAPFTLAVAIFTMVLQKSEQDNALWWDHVTSRLEQAPAWLAGERTLVTHPGRLQGEVGSKRVTLASGLLSVVLTGMAGELPPEKRARFERARDATVAALDDWKKWLDQNDARWPTNYALGRAAYNRMLKDELLLPYDADGIVALGQRTLAAAIADESDALADATARNINLVDPSLAAPQGGGAIPTTKDAEVAFFAQSLDSLVAFTRLKHIVTIPTYVGRMKIVETPAYLQLAFPGPSMNSPPLLSSARDGLYLVPPPAPNVTFVDFDRDRVLLTAGHDGLPGHFLQQSIARHNPDMIRRLALDSVFSEGWGFYEARLLQRLGLYGADLDGRYAVAQFERLRGARTVIDARLATGDWDFDRAVSWFRESAGVDTDTATAEVSRWALVPGQALNDAVGGAQLDDLLAKVRARKGAAFNLQAFNDDVLSHGTVPISIIAREMLAE